MKVGSGNLGEKRSDRRKRKKGGSLVESSGFFHSVLRLNRGTRSLDSEQVRILTCGIIELTVVFVRCDVVSVRHEVFIISHLTSSL